MLFPDFHLCERPSEPAKVLAEAGNNTSRCVCPTALQTETAPMTKERSTATCGSAERRAWDRLLHFHLLPGALLHGLQLYSHREQPITTTRCPCRKTTQAGKQEQQLFIPHQLTNTSLILLA